MPRIFDVLLGKTKPVQANLDQLFGLVSAQITLQTAEALIPTGQAGVCYKPVAGRSFADTSSETSQLLGLGDDPTADAAGLAGSVAPIVKQQDDQYGYHWVVQTVPDFQELVNQVHLINSTLQDNGYGPQLLCTVCAFRADPTATAASGPAGPPLVYLVYLYKRGTFYPFVPAAGAGEHRDNETELRLQQVLAEDLKIEPDKERWMALWGLPVH
ncbi:MAG: PspA-associated protein PspAB [Acidimicrobiales bacterium]